MKTLFNIALVGLLFMISCSEPPESISRDNEENESNPRLDRPQTIFEGEWLWIKTDGEGIEGPYTSDSTSAGYSFRYSFDWNTVVAMKDNNRDMGPLNIIEKTAYSYVYEISNDSTKQVLLLTDTITGNVETFLWEISTEEKDDSTIVIMTLMNAEPMSDNSFVQYFIRTKENIIESK